MPKAKPKIIAHKPAPPNQRGTLAAGKQGNAVGWPDLYLGIDPGKSGGMVLLQQMGKRLVVVQSTKMPEDDVNIIEWLRLLPSSRNLVACLEKISAGGFPGSSKWSTGSVYGSYRTCRMALTACGIEFVEKVAHSWQKGLGIAKTKDKETYTEFKSRLQTIAQQKFPGTKLTKAVCDAALIALFAQKHYEGQL